MLKRKRKYETKLTKRLKKNSPDGLFFIAFCIMLKKQRHFIDEDFTNPVFMPVYGLFSLLKLFFWFDFSYKSAVNTLQNRIILIRFCILLIWFQSCCTQIVPTLFLCAIFQNQRCHFFHKCICNTSAFIIKNFFLLFTSPLYRFQLVFRAFT